MTQTQGHKDTQKMFLIGKAGKDDVYPSTDEESEETITKHH